MYAGVDWSTGRDQSRAVTYWMDPSGTFHMITDQELENMPFTREQIEYAEMTARAYYERQLGAPMSIQAQLRKNDLHLKSLYDFEAVKPVKKDYQTVGVRFLQGPNLQKVYTYKVRKGAKLRLGQEIVVPTQREVLSNNIAVVVELHKTPQDTGPYDYKFVAGTVTFL